MKKKWKNEEDYEFYIYGDPSEPEFDPNDRLFDWDVYYFLADVTLILKQIYEVLCFVSFFANLFHLLILTRKELRSNLVYIIMIGVCICDIAQVTANITQLAMTHNIFYTIQPCGGGFKYSHLVVDSVSKSLQIMSRQCSCFLVLYIAAFRAFSVLNPMSNFTQSLMRPKSGILVVWCTALVCSAWSYSGGQCCGGGKRPACVPWIPIFNEKWESKYLFIDGCIAFIISVLYVIVTIVLVIALCQNRKRRKNLSNEKSSNASMMIIAMAFTIFISELTYGLLNLAGFFILQDYDDQNTFMQLDSFVLILFIGNSAVHSLICFFMSSQYRDTVRGLLWKKKPEKNMNAVLENTVSVGETSKALVSSKKTY